MVNSSNILPVPPVGLGITSHSTQTEEASALDAAIAHEVENQHSSKIEKMMEQLALIKQNYGYQSIQPFQSTWSVGLNSMDSLLENSVGGTSAGTTTKSNSSFPTTIKKGSSAVFRHGTLTVPEQPKQSIITKEPPKKPSQLKVVKKTVKLTVNNW